jgi:flagellar biosynthesis/type III secretory pathway M-ring protein FliF/YscJ
MLALLVLLPLAALAAAYLWFNPPVYRVLYTQLSDRAGGEVITALEQLNIPYRLSAADGTIEVPADHLHAARYRLAARGLPKSDADAQDEVDRAPSFGASSLQEQQRYQRALEIELARSIQALDAVELARVHLALPKVSPFLRDAPPATAAVLVRLHPGRSWMPEQVATIQTLVAAGVPRLKRAEVQVLDPRGVLLGGAAPEASQSQRLALEQDLVRRALAVLTPWLGEDRVSVQVTATLEDSETRQTVERVRNVVDGGQVRPLEKTVRTTRVPEGRIQHIQAIVILGFDASADDLWRARQMATQALGLQPARGDTLRVYALPAAASKPQADAACPAGPGSLAGSSRADRQSAARHALVPSPGRNGRWRCRRCRPAPARGDGMAARPPQARRRGGSGGFRCRARRGAQPGAGRSARDGGRHQVVDARMSQAGIEKSAALLLALGEEATAPCCAT